jgi:hypothetical protein
LVVEKHGKLGNAHFKSLIKDQNQERNPYVTAAKNNTRLHPANPEEGGTGKIDQWGFLPS